MSTLVQGLGLLPHSTQKTIAERSPNQLFQIDPQGNIAFSDYVGWCQKTGWDFSSKLLDFSKKTFKVLKSVAKVTKGNSPAAKGFEGFCTIFALTSLFSIPFQIQDLYHAIISPNPCFTKIQAISTKTCELFLSIGDTLSSLAFFIEPLSCCQVLAPPMMITALFLSIHSIHTSCQRIVSLNTHRVCQSYSKKDLMKTFSMRPDLAEKYQDNKIDPKHFAKRISKTICSEKISIVAKAVGIIATSLFLAACFTPVGASTLAAIGVTLALVKITIDVGNFVFKKHIESLHPEIDTPQNFSDYLKKQWVEFFPVH